MYTPIVSSKIIPDSKVFSDQKGPKIRPFAVAHTYIAYIREYHSLGPDPFHDQKKKV